MTLFRYSQELLTNSIASYSDCPKDKYGKDCKKKCGCDDDWCTSAGSCASDSTSNCKARVQLPHKFNPKDYNPTKDPICAGLL